MKDEPAAPAAEAPRRKKKRKPPAPGAAAPKKPARQTREPGVDFASFTEGFPKDPELDALVEAFDRGDYALVRERAPKLAASSDREDVRRAAAELRRRIDPDPISTYLILGALALLAFLSFWYWTHKH